MVSLIRTYSLVVEVLFISCRGVSAKIRSACLALPPLSVNYLYGGWYREDPPASLYFILMRGCCYLERSSVSWACCRSLCRTHWTRLRLDYVILSGYAWKRLRNTLDIECKVLIRWVSRWCRIVIHSASITHITHNTFPLLFFSYRCYKQSKFISPPI